MVSIIAWYIVVTALGMLAWPLLFTLLPGLPDRGYVMSRALGMMLVGYVFWLLGSLGFLSNTVGGILFSMLIVAGLGLWAYLTRSDRSSTLQSWLISHSRMVLVAEVLFLAAYIGWVVFRAYNPDIRFTEKPMELTFLNGVRMSPTFAPRDPWLSGYAISYYYSGYVLIAMLAELTGTPSGIAFNLGIALLFALTLLGSYGVVYNLIAVRFEAQPGAHSRGAFSALLAPLFVGVMGNLVGFLQLVHSQAWSFIPASFWEWLDIRDINVPRTTPVWPPTRWDSGWWWWRASRVINDRNINGTLGGEPIDEFPFFSFLLGDMHPHVLAIPFVLAALGLAFNALRQQAPLRRAQVVFYAVTFGGLAFLNTWDLPIYLFILVAVMVLRAVYDAHRFEVRALRQPIWTGGMIFILGVLAYLPWYLSFSSQAGGILPNALFPTRFQQFFAMFGPFLVIIVWLLVERGLRNAPHLDWTVGALFSSFVLVILIVVMVALSFGAIRIDAGARAAVASNVLPSLNGLSDADVQQQMPSIVAQVARFRLAHPLTALFLTAVIGLSVAILIPRSLRADGEPTSAPSPSLSGSTIFALILIITGALLTLGPDFVYLRDVFTHRLNTVFKFYYAAWILFGIASAYGAVLLTAQLRVMSRILFATLVAVLVSAGLVYTVIGISTGSIGMSCPDRSLPATLDGTDYLRRCFPADYQGILWLQQHGRPDDVVLEAVGGQYSDYARVSMATGIPTVMGWPGHENQWRGSLYPQLAGSRESDVREIYSTHNMQHAKDLLDRYGVTYVFVGSLERNPEYSTPAGLEKFDRFLPIVFQSEGVTIYRADQPLVEEENTP